MKELDTKQRAFVVYLSKILKCKEGDELNKKIQELPSDQLNDLSISFEKIYNTQMDGTIIAKLGAKLNYIKKLNNKCPEGYEVEMFKAGGKPCMRCKKMQEGAIPVAAHKNGKVINDIKSEIAKDKCGGKAKKKKKMECGGKTKSMSCGSKMQNGGKYDEVKKLVECKDNIKKHLKGGFLKKKIIFARTGIGFNPYSAFDKLEKENITNINQNDSGIIEYNSKNGATYLVKNDKIIKMYSPNDPGNPINMRKKESSKKSLISSPDKKQTFVEYLNNMGIDSSFSNRKKLAKKYNISNYKGTYEQNMKLWDIIRTDAELMPNSPIEKGWVSGLDY